ncbi:hypothetical protein N8364_03360 [Saprospiraceae bacterium]|nr:hypothetical protein [Saprospiraceae bacterium]MDC1508690.1 hypothetical protein [Saprospiraceae bacterium]|tara:strand:+ start:105 stop:506 length:402 start_codon:yes stop_codon:yes gene_type:complete
MKKLLILSTLLIFAFGCDEESDDIPLPAYTIEGKWVIDGGVPEGNTMYLFEDGVRYTYYCVEGDCQSLYDSFQAGDGNHIPGTNPYTFEDDVLTVDLHFGNELISPIRFECNGGEVYFETPGYSLFRLSSDCN